MPEWKSRYAGAETLKVAVMGCVVNGPGESRVADIGISLPGTGESPRAPVFVDGKRLNLPRRPHHRQRLRPDGRRLRRNPLGPHLPQLTSVIPAPEPESSLWEGAAHPERSRRVRPVLQSRHSRLRPTHLPCHPRSPRSNPRTFNNPGAGPLVLRPSKHVLSPGGCGRSETRRLKRPGLPAYPPPSPSPHPESQSPTRPPPTPLDLSTPDTSSTPHPNTILPETHVYRPQASP